MLTHSELIAPTPDRPETPSEAGLPPRPATPASTNPPPPTPPVQQPPTRAVRQRVTNARPPPLGSLTLRAKSGFDFAMHRPFHRDGGASGAARDRSPCRGCVRRVDRRWRGLCDGFASGWGGGGGSWIGGFGGRCCTPGFRNRERARACVKQRPVHGVSPYPCVVDGWDVI